MNELILHIEFLLHHNQCVIVPNLGGFVINLTPVTREGINVFNSPKCELIFNQSLSFNDGLLAESYMRMYECSFEKAMILIDEAVHETKYQIEKFGSVHMGNLGIISLNPSSQFNFTPKEFSYPSFFGFTPSQLKPIINLQPISPSIENSDKKSHNARTISIALASAAAIIALILFLNIFKTDFSMYNEAQLPGIPSKEIISHKIEKPKNVVLKPVVSNKVEESISTPKVEVAEQTSTPQTLNQNTLPQYYIVVGVYEVEKMANETLSILHKNGFSKASYVKKRKRINVFAESFDNKNSAYSYLNDFIKSHPQYKDAWVLKY